MDLRRFRAVWVVDFEFQQPGGSRPHPWCLVAHEMRSGRRLALWEHEMHAHHQAPFDVGDDALFVAYYSSAECGCMLELGWSLPVNVLDLYAEFRVATNGRELPSGNGLLGALVYHGLPAMADDEKAGMRGLAQRGGPFTNAEKSALLDYCGNDVESTRKLFVKMAPIIDVPRALIRGRYMKAVARIERNGIPIDVPMLDAMRGQWDEIKLALIERVDTAFGVFDGTTFKTERFAAWCQKHGIGWRRLASGALALDRDTFRDMAKRHPHIMPLHELRTTLAELRLNDLAVGGDGRNRCLLSPFRAKTGRNAPSTSKFIFGPAAWIRSLIRPEPGWAMAYIDWSQQEFGIAAALSGDANMLAAYQSSDPYLKFANMAGAVPANATKQSHPREREQFKVCALATLYGMGAKSLAIAIGGCEADARYLLAKHRAVFKTFWRWRDAAVAVADLHRRIRSVFGWQLHFRDGDKPTTVANFPMQANGAEMLRLACIAATENGVRVCAPVHDALLIEAPKTEFVDAIEATQAAMRWASAQVLGGFELRSDVKLIRSPDRYIDGRGKELWDTVVKFISAKSKRENVGVKFPFDTTAEPLPAEWPTAWGRRENWLEDEVEILTERAAIIEFDGNVSRREAELRALAEFHTTRESLPATPKPNLR